MQRVNEMERLPGVQVTHDIVEGSRHGIDGEVAQVQVFLQAKTLQRRNIKDNVPLLLTRLRYGYNNAADLIVQVHIVSSQRISQASGQRRRITSSHNIPIATIHLQ